MAKTNSSKRFMNMAYGLGASVVILGALLKITHWEIAGIVTGNQLLAIGLITEAFIFALSAFETPEKEYDWSLAYPELNEIGGDAKNRTAQGVLAQKIDKLMNEAQIDVALMNKLGEAINNFEGAAKGIAPTTEAIDHTQKYNEQISHAASQMQALNDLYKAQLDHANMQSAMNREMIENGAELKKQMESLVANMEQLNAVYGGMLTAIKK